MTPDEINDMYKPHYFIVGPKHPTGARICNFCGALPETRWHIKEGSMNKWRTMWDRLRAELTKKNSWGKNELERLMMDIERDEIRKAEELNIER